MVCHIAHALELRQLLQQGFFDASLERLVNGAAALTTTTKLQYGVLVLGNLDQADLATMGCQRGVHFVIQDIIDAVTR